MRRGRNRYRGGESFSLNLTPLLDVVLQLITFFMMLVHFGTQLEGSTKDVRLPLTPAALPGADLPFDRLTVVVDARGRLIAESGTLEGREAAGWWDKEAKLRLAGQETLGGPVNELPTIVIVRADRNATYGMIRRTLAQAQQRGFAHFSLVVLRSESR